MPLFKSREERRFERNQRVRRALALIRRQIKDQERHERAYITQARRARQLGQSNQYEYLKRLVKKTITIRARLERQLLSLEAAAQVKDQAEGQAAFASGMAAVSKAISEVYRDTNFERVQAKFEQAMSQAASLEERTDSFLEAVSDSMFEYEGGPEQDLVSDADIERLLEDEVTEAERRGDADVEGVGKRMDDDLENIRREIEKNQK